MFCEDACLGSSCGLEKMRSINDKLNTEVVERINGSQELVMLTNFARESNEYHYKKCLQERISDVSSWRWVLEDLSKRLDEAVRALKYEENALRVVVERIKDEIQTKQASRPGAMNPLCDVVEEAIKQEYNFLKEEKKKFENLIPELEQQTANLEKTKKRIDKDIQVKDQAISVDENCVDKNYSDAVVDANWKEKKKKGLPIKKWEKRCLTLKRAGLRALSNSIVTRQQVRGARIQLSYAAQAMSARVDTVLRRRIHSNAHKLDDLKWQKEEAIRDLRSLEEEQAYSEQNLIEVMNQERVVAARIMDRAKKPSRELIMDDANRKLRTQLSQIRTFSKELTNNIDRIVSLQHAVSNAISKIDCTLNDLSHILILDEERLSSRTGEVEQKSSSTVSISSHSKMKPQSSEQLTVIQEENEDDYPFDF
ncbi:putative leucine-rich repeat-containing protein DDB_G0290503 [Pieris napi]|uniref:putative leucine-rich repeat-containing protein DDB_G0290503 n=1 Tax=Pieris napi TaxID=78633 RepID=UPI001FBAF811|nr:putative leucine-rich repeat-containing protein DDB_G0290503 [Pieris napi]